MTYGVDLNMAVRRFLFSIATWLLALVVPAVAQTQDPPLFAAFKSFCVDAGSDPRQVQKAVELAGGKPHNPPGSSTTTPWPMTVQIWDITAQGRSMILDVGAGQAPFGPAMVSNSTTCTITRFGGDESASMQALREWVAVPRQGGRSFPEYYHFRLVDGAHRPIADKDIRAAEETEDTWLLTLIGNNSFQFMHTMAPVPKKAD
jgi:hypothetical protein